ncbi:hypothetical protein [Agrobacterium pusense]|uniref:Uncharacterized protein n=1 Tax=Agrobacterium pusense TaxID=648995 RepID=A0A6H0ZVH8_9HYPH|nr:hypothetical protein [Agrobacterium pusense]PZP76052.1 MAG: hypothetical protein DI604_02765 [Delftia acidovorans]QIX24024.1 hypothetical protein FOB41_23180 [Agrobacterium pusense]
MYRITSKSVAMLFRLAMVLSLSFYSFSTVNAAMHPASSLQISQMEDDYSSHHGREKSAAATADHHGDQHDHDSAEKSKNSCCKDYCGVAAITCSGSTLSHPRVVSIHEIGDDTDTAGEAPRLHRPPNI